MLDTWIVRCTPDGICGENPIRGCKVVHPAVSFVLKQGLPSRRRHCPINPAIRQATLRKTTGNRRVAGIIAEDMSLMGVRNQPFSIRSLAMAPIWLATIAVLLAEPVPARAQGAVKSVHGDWQIRCDTPAGAQAEQCALIQSVVAEDRSNAGLTVIILKTADQKSKLMRVVAPLGVLLPSGLGLKLDDKDVGRAGFVRCLPNGCVAEVVMEDTLLNQLKTAKTATFIIFETPEEGIGFPLSLKGLGEGYDKLP
jgi:invasion protein IalB